MDCLNYPNRMWRRYAVLAFLGLSVVLARPICDAFALPSAASHAELAAVGEHGSGKLAHHSDESGTCCASVDDAALVASVAATPAESKASTTVFMGSVSSVAWPMAAVRRIAASPPQAPPRSVSYHARSARILL